MVGAVFMGPNRMLSPPLAGVDRCIYLYIFNTLLSYTYKNNFLGKKKYKGIDMKKKRENRNWAPSVKVKGRGKSVSKSAIVLAKHFGGSS